MSNSIFQNGIVIFLSVLTSLIIVKIIIYYFILVPSSSSIKKIRELAGFFKGRVKFYVLRGIYENKNFSLSLFNNYLKVTIENYSGKDFSIFIFSKNFGPALFMKKIKIEKALHENAIIYTSNQDKASEFLNCSNKINSINKLFDIEDNYRYLLGNKKFIYLKIKKNRIEYSIPFVEPILCELRIRKILKNMIAIM